MSRYDLQNGHLIAAFEQLQREETTPGQWALGGTNLPFGDELQSRFPLVGRFLDDNGEPARSGLSPAHIAKQLEGVFH
jgi:hypothetical protein